MAISRWISTLCVVGGLLFFASSHNAGAHDKDKPSAEHDHGPVEKKEVPPPPKGTPLKIESTEAWEHPGKLVVVTFKVRSTNAAGKHKTIFLDSEDDFHDEKNLGVAISEHGAADLKAKKKIDAATHFRNKEIRAVGVIEMRENRTYLDVHHASQIDLAPEDEDDEAAPKS